MDDLTGCFNVISLSEKTGVKYHRIRRAIKEGDPGLLSAEEKKALYDGASKALRDFKYKLYYREYKEPVNGYTEHPSGESLCTQLKMWEDRRDNITGLPFNSAADANKALKHIKSKINKIENLLLNLDTV